MQYLTNCKMGTEFQSEIDSLYTQLVTSCVEKNVNLNQEFCDKKKTKQSSYYDTEESCEEYIPCSIVDNIEEFQSSLCFHSKLSSILLIFSLIFFIHNI